MLSTCVEVVIWSNVSVLLKTNIFALVIVVSVFQVVLYYCFSRWGRDRCGVSVQSIGLPSWRC